MSISIQMGDISREMISMVLMARLQKDNDESDLLMISWLETIKNTINTFNEGEEKIREAEIYFAVIVEFLVKSYQFKIQTMF